MNYLKFFFEFESRGTGGAAGCFCLLEWGDAAAAAGRATLRDGV